MTTRSSSVLATLLVSAALLTGRPAAAQPSAADVETARALYVEGLELRDAGQLDISLARFKAAHALATTPITCLELGRAHVLLAQLLEGRDVLLSVERLPVLPGESAKGAAARVEARALAEQLRERIPSLRIVLVPEPPAGATVTIDGVAIPPGTLASPRKVNPGSHVVVAEGNGARATTNVVISEHDLRMVTLALPASGTPETSPGASRPAPGPGGWFYVGVGGTGVGILVGTITGVIAITKANRLETECTGPACPRTAADDLSSSRTMGVVSTIAFSVAAASAALAVVSYLYRPSSGTNVRHAPNPLRWTW